MAESAAIKAFGTLLKRGDGGSPEAFSTVAEVRDISGPNFSAQTVAVTHQESPGGFAEKIATILDGGQVTFELGFLPASAGHKAILSDYTSRTKRNYRLQFPDGGSTYWPFAAIVTGFSPKEPVAGDLTADVTLEITGQVTLP